MELKQEPVYLAKINIHQYFKTNSLRQNLETQFGLPVVVILPFPRYIAAVRLR